MEMLIIFIVFVIALACRYYFNVQLKKGKISLQNRNNIRLAEDITFLICIVALAIDFGLHLYAQRLDNHDITIQIIVYALFIIGCIVHFFRVFKKDLNEIKNSSRKESL